jgi:HSP20 family molecular chaperone IbpA
MTWKPSGSRLESMNMNQFMQALDEKSSQILAYLLREKHAGIRVLADLIHASSDMEVLLRIRQVINSKAQENVGEPLLVFEPSKLHPLTGERITFSWWLNERLAGQIPAEALFDVHDEKDALRVIASIPLEEDIEVEVRGNFLIIAGKNLRQEVLLTSAVEPNVRKRVNNGVLEIMLKKSGEKTW